MSLECPRCGAVIFEAGQNFCSHCGAPLDGDEFPASKPRGQNPAGAWEQTKTGISVVYGLVLCVVAVAVIGGGIWGLFGGGRVKPPAVPQTPKIERSSISEFTTTAKTEEGFGGRGGRTRVIAIKYNGKKVLEDVVVTVSLHFVSREKTTETSKFASWKPGETQYLSSSDKVGRAVHYSWSGTATVDGQEVFLAGGEGNHE